MEKVKGIAFAPAPYRIIVNPAQILDLKADFKVYMAGLAMEILLGAQLEIDVVVEIDKTVSDDELWRAHILGIVFC